MQGAIVKYQDWQAVNQFYQDNLITTQTAQTSICANCHEIYTFFDGSMICSTCDLDWESINKVRTPPNVDAFVYWINHNPRAGRRATRNVLTKWLPRRTLIG